jgi:pyruvate dehydrogenase E2 component (dihydrolipoamide acetyltransferase)
VASEIVMPRLSDSMEEGTILTWLVAEGDEIDQGQPIAEIETDKATVTFEAVSGGVILALSVGAGATVPVGAPIFVIGERGESVARERVEPAPPAQATAAAAVPVQARETRRRPKASPLARRVAEQRGIDLAGLAGSGPDGRVIRADVERVGAGNGAPSARGPARVRELTRLQRTVARRMTESRARVPDIELRVEVDMEEAVALRERLREVADPPPSINDFMIKAAALALREFPRVNGAYLDSTSVETYARVNVGFAVAADDALVVPTLFDADRKSLGEIAVAARTLAASARAGTIKPSELDGGTFTISNLGMYGVDSFSAVINQPQAAILAIGSLKRRPAVDESGEVVARLTVVLTLACDHRILYGADGARFLARVRELLERPHALLL